MLRPSYLILTVLLVSRVGTVRAEEATDDGAITTVSGFAQVDYQVLERSQDELSDGTGEPLNEDLFRVRRARLTLARDWTHLGVRSITEFFGRDGIQAVGLDVHAQLPGAAGQPPLLRARAGFFEVPFTYDSHDLPAFERFFGERALFVESFVPGRFDAGVSVDGHYQGISWVVAVQNGEPIDSPFAYEDPNDGKDAAARLRIEDTFPGGLELSLGASMIYGKGFSPGTPPTKDTFEWRDLNEDGRVLPSELIPIPGTAGRSSQSFDRWGLGVDVQVKAEIPQLGPLLAYAEIARGVNLDRLAAPADPVLLGRDQRSLGWYVALVQSLSEYATAGLRYEAYEPNADLLELYDGISVVTRRKFHLLTAGLSANMVLPAGARGRLLLEYVAEWNSLGRDAAGRPDQLDNDVMRARAEVVF